MHISRGNDRFPLGVTLPNLLTTIQHACENFIYFSCKQSRACDRTSKSIAFHRKRAGSGEGGTFLVCTISNTMVSIAMLSSQCRNSRTTSCPLKLRPEGRQQKAVPNTLTLLTSRSIGGQAQGFFSCLFAAYNSHTLRERQRDLTLARY